MAPIAFGVEITQPELVGLAGEDLCNAPRQFPRDEVLTTSWRLVVEQDPAACIQVMRLTVVHGHPVGVQLGRGIRAARMERRRLALGSGGEPEHLRRRRL